jgi:TolA-binding protein
MGRERGSNMIAHEPRDETDYPDLTSTSEQIRDLQLRVAALSRRVEELEAKAFQLVGEEEIILVAVPRARTPPGTW